MALRTTFVLLLGLIGLGPATAADRVEVVRFDGTRLAGDLVRGEGDRIVVRADERLVEFETRDLVSVRRVEIPTRQRPAEPPRAIVEIANGDRLAALPVSADEDGVRVQWSYLDAEPVDLPLETVRSIAWRLSRKRAGRETVLSRLRTHAGDGDRLESENGDAILGEFRGFADETVSLAVAGAMSKVPVSGLRGLAFDPSLVSVPKTPARHVLVELVDGTRLTAKGVQLDDDLRIETTFGPIIALPRTTLAELRFVGGRAVDLSDREPVAFEQTPWFGPQRTWQRDRGVTGVPMQIGERRYRKGVGVQAHARLTYAVGPGDRSFRATVGLDASAGDRGSARFVVRLDGREVRRTPIVRGGDDPLEIEPIDLSGAKRLELVVEAADHGDVLDRANWCDALIVGD